MSPAHAAVNRRPLAAEQSKRGSPIRRARTRASDVRATDHSSRDGTASGRETWLRTRDDGDIVATLLGGNDRLLGEILAAVEWAPNCQLGAQDGKQERALRTVSGESSQRELENLDLLCVDGVDGAERPSIIGEGRGDQSIDITNIDCSPGGAKQSVTKPGISRLTLGGSESNTEIEPERLIRIASVCPEIERLRVVTERVVRSQTLQRSIGGLT